MSMTKRMMESGRRLATAKCDGVSASEKIDAFFLGMRSYHFAFVKGKSRKTRAEVHRSLETMVSYSKVNGDINKAGGVNAYLTHYFYENFKRCLRDIGLPPQEIEELAAATSATRQYCISLAGARKYAPTDAELKDAETIRPKARRFRYHNPHTPGLLHDAAIHRFYSKMFEKKKSFYMRNPDALFKVEFLEYEDYLQSPIWFVIRNTVLFRDSFKCRVCKEKATTVHHVSYEADVRYGKDLAPLVSLCEECHEQIEFEEDGRKISDLEVKKQRLESLQASRKA